MNFIKSDIGVAGSTRISDLSEQARAAHKWPIRYDSIEAEKALVAISDK